jgi:hypothetical protein
MGVIVGLTVVAAAVVALAVSVFTDVALWQSSKHVWRQIVESSPRTQHDIVVRTAVMFLVVGAWFGAVLARPFGTRATLLYLVALPILVLVFAAGPSLACAGTANPRGEARAIALRDSTADPKRTCTERDKPRRPTVPSQSESWTDRDFADVSESPGFRVEWTGPGGSQLPLCLDQAGVGRA